MKKYFPLFCLLVTSCSPDPTSALKTKLSGYIDIVVAKDGTGNVTTVQEAVNLVPDGNMERKVIFVRNGIYKEKVTVPSGKRYITIIGEDTDSVILTYDDYSGKEVDGVLIETNSSFSFAVDADDFEAMNLTFANSAGPVGQAVALRTKGDRQFFFNCRLIGHQDTYYTWGNTRNYLRNCFIEGTTDYIFGRSTVVFDSCHINSLKTGSFITAASTEEGVKFGYVFLNCLFTGNPAIRDVFLGRPWRPYARTVIINSYLDEFINPQGWSIWRGNENHLTCYYAEYGNHGPKSGTDERIGWSHQLTDNELLDYDVRNIFSKETNPEYFENDWNPDFESDALYQIVREWVKTNNSGFASH